MTPTVTIDPATTKLADIRAAFDGPIHVLLPAGYEQRMQEGRRVLEDAVARNEVVYAVTTGFGKLADRSISPDDITELQRRLIRSHQVGVGPLLPARVVRGVLLLKVIALVQGNSAVRPELVELLVSLLEHDLLPCVPAQGSVGASGDLAPLAHLTAALIGESDMLVDGRRVPATEAMAAHGIAPLQLAAKEAIALINGTQVSTSLALAALYDAERVLRAAVASGTLSLAALSGNLEPFDGRIHALRRQVGQVDVAKTVLSLAEGSAALTDNRPRRTQDMYSLRCQPQVVGAALDLLRFAASTLEREANAVTDNPLVFPADDAILSGGNFHAEPVAFAADIIAIALCEIGAISERRQFVLNDESLSRLPAFLTATPGLNSGMTMTQVTSAALVAENRGNAFPRSVDSVPTVANQEDHVSMATHAARRTIEIATNTAQIIAIELVMGAQAIDIQQGTADLGPALTKVYEAIREHEQFLDDDRPLAPGMSKIAQQLLAGRFDQLVEIDVTGGRS